MHKPGLTSEESVKAGYEVSDIQVNGVVISLSALFILLFSGVIFGVIYLRFMESSTAPLATVTAYPVSGSGEVAKPFPLLQQNPEKDRREFIKAAQEKLNSLGTYENTSQVHVKIDDAMKLIAGGQAPYRQAPKIALESEETDPADPFAEGI